MPFSILRAELWKYRDDDAVRDPLTEVGVTPRCLRRMEILSGGWARLTPASASAVTASHSLSATSYPDDPGFSSQRFSNEDIEEGSTPTAPSVANTTAGHANRSFRNSDNRNEGGLLCRVVAMSVDPGDKGFGERMLADDEVLLPPSLAFNAGLGPFSTHVNLRRETRRIGGAGEGGWGQGEQISHRPPPVACTASVSTVKRPRSSDGSTGTVSSSSGRSSSTAKQARAHALALTAFFSTPRVLRVGDVFGVSVPCPAGSGRGGGARRGRGGGVGGNLGAVGCWWQEVQEDNDYHKDDEVLEEEDQEEHEEEKDNHVTDATEQSRSVEEMVRTGAERPGGLVGNVRCPYGSYRAVGVFQEGIAGVAVVNNGEQRQRRQRSRRCSPEERRFRDAIVRQGSELIYFRVSGLEGEGGIGGDRSTTNATTPSTVDGGDGGEFVGNDEVDGSSSSSGGRHGGVDGRGECMVVSRSATALRQGGAVCSAVPETTWYHGFVCREQGYPCPPAQPPLVRLERTK